MMAEQINPSFVSDENTLESAQNNLEHSNEDKLKQSSDSAKVSDSRDVEPTKNELIYRLEEYPPWHVSLLLGIQQFLTMVVSTISIPYVIMPAICIQKGNPIQTVFISTIIFVSGIITLLQTTFGVRLPIIQGGTFSFMVPTLALLKTSFPPCESINYSNMTQAEIDEEYLVRIREIQGCISIASLFQVIIGSTGLVGFLLKFITPLTIVPTISLIGLALYEEAAVKASSDWLISSLTLVLFILFSQIISEVKIPIPNYSKEEGWSFNHFPFFKLFPVLISIVLAWVICAIATATNAFPADSLSRTDRQLSILLEAPWFYFPYPFQWGVPTVSLAGVLGIVAGSFVSTIESIGDYYACAHLTESPPPPTHAMNRGIFIEGIGCILAGIWGTGNGTTSYTSNIAIVSITLVASRIVIQVAGFALLIAGVSGKFCALFVTVPEPVIGGIFIILFAMITAVGLSNLQLVDLNSSRNLFILGFSIFLGLALPSWMKKNQGAVDSGSPQLDQVVTILLSTSMFVGGVTALILDNTIAGTKEERGVVNSKVQEEADKQESEDQQKSCYDLPFGMSAIRRYRCFTRVPISPTFKGCFSREQKEKLKQMQGVLKRPWLKLFPKRSS